MKKFHGKDSDMHLMSLRQGCQKSLDYFSTLMSKSLFFSARRQIRDEFDAKTVVQETFLYIWHRREVFQSVSHLVNTAFKVVHYKCINHLKNADSAKKKNTTILNIENLSDIASDASDLDSPAEKSRLIDEHLLLIEEGISYLNEDAQLPMRLKVLGFSHRRIAGLINRSIQWTSSSTNASIKFLAVKCKQLERIAKAKANRSGVPLRDYHLLSPRQAEIMKLYEQNFNFTEIAMKMGLSPMQVTDEFIAADAILKKSRRRR
jgi:DNA-directed RNA polymerase specialized sigma24 family protein